MWRTVFRTQKVLNSISDSIFSQSWEVWDSLSPYDLAFHHIPVQCELPDQ